MKKQAPLIIFILLTFTGFAQDMFYRIYAEESFYIPSGLQISSQNDYIYTGGCVMVTDMHGHVKSNTYLVGQYLRDIVPYSNSTYIATGMPDIGYIYGTLIKQINSNGSDVWAKAFNQGMPTSSTSTSDGSIYVTGSSGGVMFLTLSSNGTLTSSTTFTDSLSSSIYGQKIIRTSDDQLLITGILENKSSERMTFLMKLTRSGSVLWARGYDSPGNQSVNDVIETTDGGFIVGGATQDSASSYNSDIHIFKTSANGTLLWSKVFGDSNDDKAIAIRKTLDGNYAVACELASTNPNPPSPCSPNPCTDALLIKLDGQGNTLWMKAYGDYLSENVYNMVVTNEGGFVITGSTDVFSGASVRPFTFKVDSSGNSLCYSHTPSSIHSYNVSAQTTQRVIKNRPLILTPISVSGNYWTRTPNNKAPICSSIGLEELEQAKSTISLSPNPTTGPVTVTIKEPYRSVQVAVRDLSGKLLNHDYYLENEPINITFSGPSGLYFLEITINEKQSFQHKVIKQ